MKKILSVFSALAMIFATACDPENKENKDLNPDAVAVTQVVLNKTELTLEQGQSEFLVAKVMPDNATDKHITWSSSNEDVALVEEGKVGAKKVGEAIITAKAGDKEASCKVIVKKTIVNVTGVELNKTELTLLPGQTEQLVATVMPENATNKLVNWISANETVATVTEDGLVTAIKSGEAVIHAQCSGIDATCTVKVVYPVTAVDLGLPSGLKWADMNVGASKPEEFGDYFTWGGVSPHYSSLDPLTWKSGMSAGYTWSTYEWGKKYNELTKYCDDSSYWGGGYYTTPDNKNILESADDAAQVILGGAWRIPTPEEKEELRKKCTWTYEVVNGVKGARLTGPNQNSIFLPAAGAFDGGSGMGGTNGDGSKLNRVGVKGVYWTSSTVIQPYPYPRSATALEFFLVDDVAIDNGTVCPDRCVGYTIRAVTY